MKHFHVVIAHEKFTGIEALPPILAEYAKNDAQLVAVAGNMFRRKYPGIKGVYLRRNNLDVRECDNPKCLEKPDQQRLF